ncbi:DUF883 family protein [Nitrosococcus watsonii]|uniref:DUF883 domain-containing protein n=1 Tax=Nitrosococcus watsoni (strain C-113) TaxID=105559 RepID=D8K5L9_NITWC|nr:DUF883 family protein [Nitrosococcus watsonii]ADJ28196.1 protein of unknown function DUF883 ElaB [Nitrosococcus watsonii C-113]
MTDTTLQKEIDGLKKELGQLRKEIGGVISEVKSHGQSVARTTQDKAEERLDEILAKLNKAYVSARESGQQATIATQREIKKHPVASASIAVIGIAFLVGLLLRK